MDLSIRILRFGRERQAPAWRARDWHGMEAAMALRFWLTFLALWAGFGVGLWLVYAIMDYLY